METKQTKPMNGISDMLDNTITDYDEKMLRTFIGKDNKFFWYKNAFAKYEFNGVEHFAWNWSWYSFFFAPFYFIYRKLYLEGFLMFFII
jgi:hypothetical protein